MKYLINFIKDVKLFKKKIFKYITKDRDFVNKIFPAIKDASIIIQKSSSWGARIKFLPKKKRSQKLRVIHNFIFINKYTIKSLYPIYRFEEVLDTIIKPSYDVYFIAKTSNSYWVVSRKGDDYNKTDFVTPNSL